MWKVLSLSFSGTPFLILSSLSLFYIFHNYELIFSIICFFPIFGAQPRFAELEQQIEEEFAALHEAVDVAPLRTIVPRLEGVVKRILFFPPSENEVRWTREELAIFVF